MKKPADAPRMRCCPERSRAKPVLLSPLPLWSEIPLRQRHQLVAAVCQMIVAQLLRQGAAPEARDEHVKP
jgi:hypothetical protein